MIGKLRGRYDGRSGSAVLIEVGGVSYSLHTTLSFADALASTKGAVEAYTHMAVREDAIDLYGFPTPEDLSFFRMLIGVSGVGPKIALGVLNLADTRTLKNAIAGGDTTYLTRVFGIGKKSAERIVVELKDKLSKDGYGAKGSAEDGDVLDALTALGYTADEARTALKAVAKEADAGGRLRKALQILGS